MNTAALPTHRTQSANPYKWENCDHLELTQEEWVVKGLLPKEGLAILAGQSTAGKSFIALDLTDRIARGERAFGDRRTSQCGVAYIAAEGANGLRKRLVGLRSERGTDWSGHMALSGTAPNLADESQYLELEKEIGRLQTKLGTNGVRLGVVVIDTLSASIPGVDENSSKDMSSVLSRLQNLAARKQICVLLVAHVGKDSERGVRGWSGLVANADVVISVQMPDEDGIRTVKIVKNKDSDTGTDLAFSLKSIDLGKDEDGDSITTCVVDWLAPENAPRGNKRTRALPTVARNALQQLNRLIEDGATELIVAPGAPSGTVGVRGEALKAALNAVAAATDPEPDACEKLEYRRWKDRRRKALTDGLAHLQERGIARTENGLIWFVRDSQVGIR